MSAEQFTLETQYPYSKVTYDGLKYPVNEIKSENTKRLESELLGLDRMSPEFLAKRHRYEQSANADYDAIEARHPDYSPKFYQDERSWYKLLRQRA